MINQRKDIINIIGIGLILVLFFAVLSSFSDTCIRQSNRAVRHDLISGFQSNQESAVVSKVIQCPSNLKSGIQLLPDFFVENANILAADKKITHTISLQNKTGFLFLPVNPCRFYYHLFPKNPEDLPVLS